MSFIKNTTIVLISNLSTIVSGVLVGFILPMVLSVDDYGFYKTFTLYVTYLGIFSLGIIDGIVLRYGSLNYEKLDKKKFRAYFKWYLLIQLFFAFIISLFALVIREPEIRVIILCLSINLVALNITGYFRQISEITQRFKEYSIVKFITSFLNIIVVLALFLCRNYYDIKYDIYIYMIVATNALISIWYISRYKSISFGSSISLKESFADVVDLTRQGIPLMVANLCSTLILTLDRQFVNILFENRVYAVYAFAYNLLSLLTVATSAISTVLYPTLKRSTKEQMQHNYENIVVLLSTVIFMSVSCYFPLCFIIQNYLPKYLNALKIFRIILPALPLTSIITVIIHNYYKTYGKSNLYFKKSIVILVISFFANLVAYCTIGTPASISIASVVTIFIWYLYADSYFFNEYKHNRMKIVCYCSICMIEFYVITLLSNLIVAFILYIGTITVTSSIFWSNKRDSLLKLVRRGRE